MPVTEDHLRGLSRSGTRHARPFVVQENVKPCGRYLMLPEERVRGGVGLVEAAVEKSQEPVEQGDLACSDSNHRVHCSHQAPA